VTTLEPSPRCDEGQDALATPTSFGQGGDDPYRRRLRATSSQPAPAPRRGEASRLDLLRCDGELPAADAHHTGVSWDLAFLRGLADAADLCALAGLEGPLLDVGCGPGRMVAAATARGVVSLGVDVAHEAVTACHDRGVAALHQSVFSPMPDQGRWRSVLLLDGNLGIGGSPAALFARCLHLLAPGGRLVVEVDGDDSLDEGGHYLVADDVGGRSGPFPWARQGGVAALATLAAAGFTRVEDRLCGGRRFLVAEAP
jgi:SAM-dependent methyltransferase